MLLYVLILGVVIDLLVDILAHSVDFLSLLAHLFSVLRDPDPLIVQALFLLVDG